ncbi:type II toxin-antitoxin system HigA family antitoxin [Pseudomonas sp. SCT]|uniref:helix-turn-helix domain-containing protein n=1 Tax=Pseudomonas sp. (strain SCT) TaxID=412955 RepID=UPI002115A8E4|nr:transcriptional regulator [Pseudomonas sp. SCT]
MLSKPTNEDDYDALVEALDELLALVGDDEDHPLAGLASRVGDMIEAYDELRRPLPETGGVEVLLYLMREHGLRQGDLPDVATQSVISEGLAGKRQLNVRHIRALSDRFRVSADVFL